MSNTGDRNSIFGLDAIPWEYANCSVAMLQVRVFSISIHACACSLKTCHVFRRRQNVWHFFKQDSHHQSLRVTQAAPQAHLESAWRRSEIMSNVPFAFDEIGHAELFKLSCG